MRPWRFRWSLKEALDTIVTLLAFGTPVLLAALAWSWPAAPSWADAPLAIDAAPPSSLASVAGRSHFRLIRPGVAVWHHHREADAAVAHRR